MALYLFKDEIEIKDSEGFIERIIISFNDNELKSAKKIVDKNPNFFMQHENDYRGIGKQSVYVGFFPKKIQIQDIEKSLLEDLINALHPKLFTNVSVYRGRLDKYPISEIWDIYKI